MNTPAFSSRFVLNLMEVGNEGRRQGMLWMPGVFNTFCFFCTWSWQPF